MLDNVFKISFIKLHLTFLKWALITSAYSLELHKARQQNSCAWEVSDKWILPAGEVTTGLAPTRLPVF